MVEAVQLRWLPRAAVATFVERRHKRLAYSSLNHKCLRQKFPDLFVIAKLSSNTEIKASAK